MFCSQMLTTYHMYTWERRTERLRGSALYAQLLVLFMWVLLFCIVLTRKAIPQKGFLFHFLKEHSFAWRIVGTSKMGHCKTQTMHSRLKMKVKIQTAEFLSKSCYHFCYRELTLNRLSWEYNQANPGEGLSRLQCGEHKTKYTLF